MKQSDFSKIYDLIDYKSKNLKNYKDINEGHNGPYYDYETLSRNISHWICIFGDFYLKTKKQEYKKLVNILSEYYKDNKDVSDCGLYFCRKKEGKDNVNGTIGHAWIIEGLVMSYRILDDKFFLNEAKRIFTKFTFNYKKGLWNVIDTNGHNNGVDYTYNHQLWFAAAGSEILNCEYDDEIYQKISTFLDKSNVNFKILPNGTVYHLAYTSDSIIGYLKKIYKYYKHIYDINHGNASLEYKEIGYQMFNIFGFAILQDQFKKHSIFRTKKFRKALDFCVSDEYKKKLFEMDRGLDITKLESNNVDKNINTYAFPYNSPAFELPYILEKFDLRNEKNDKICYELLNTQIKYSYKKNDICLSNNTEDKNTLNARIYELTKSSLFWENGDINEKQ